MLLIVCRGAKAHSTHRRESFASSLARGKLSKSMRLYCLRVSRSKASQLSNPPLLGHNANNYTQNYPSNRNTYNLKTRKLKVAIVIVTSNFLVPGEF
eukprot:4912722-Amphidinium_carterae.1